jgi:hypothetical protein
VSLTDWTALILCAIGGWAIVSWIFGVVRQQKAPPVEMHVPAANEAPKRKLSVAELSERWHLILIVPSEAGAAEIERAYHERLAECDRVRFTTTASVEEKRAAEERRVEVTRAFEFIRPQRGAS